MTPILYESTETGFLSLGIGALNDCLSCYVKTVLNGVFELEMRYPVTGKRYPDLQINRIIKAVAQKGGTPQLFDIYAISKPLNGIVTVYATHVSGRKQFIPVMPCSGTTVAETLLELDGACAITNPFTLWTDKTTVANFNLIHPASLGQCLGGMQGSVLDVYGGEYEFDNFVIKLWNHRGQDNGVSLRYGKNITDIEQEESIAATITGICPFWEDAEGNVVVLPEMYVESVNAANFPFKRTVVMDFSAEFESEPTVQQLRDKATAYVAQSNIGVPAVSISLAYENLADYEEFANVALLEQVRLGDTVHVDFEPLGITATARVVQTDYDVLADKYKSTKIGSIKGNLGTVLNTMAAETSQEILESTSGLEAAFQRAVDLLAGAEGGNIVIRTNPVTGKPYEILIMDTDDVNTAVKVLRLNMNGLGLSTNGINGNYTACITADGIVATTITSGTLNADLIKAGILMSQDSQNDPSFYLNLLTGVLKGKFSELSISGQTVQQIADATLNTFIQGQYAQDLADLQQQVDGQIETWFDNYVPTASNAPANTWTTTADKDNHLGDLFYVVDNQQHGGECYRWVYDNGTYKWQLVEDSAVATALAEALAAQTLAGEKARVFVTTPVPPYDVGDLWLNANAGGDILRCQTAKTASQSYAAADWVKASGYVTDVSLTQYDVLRRLTNDFADEGLYLQNGHLYMNATYVKSGTLQGVRVEAQEGLIGGWTIDSQRIKKERTSGNTLYRACLYAPTTPNTGNGAFYIGKQDLTTEEWTYPIRLEYGGRLVATEAEISGTVNAGAGNIGGWTIDETELRKSVTISNIPYTLVLRAGDPNNGSLALFVRKVADGETSYPFSVSYSGQLKATDADISGKITAESGSIGGWEITNKQLRKIVTLDGVTYTPGMQAVSSGTGAAAFYVAKTESGTTTYPFIVRYSGALTATDATITGRILANSGIIGNSATNKITIGTNGTNASIYNGMASLDDTTHNGFYIGADGFALGKGKFKVTNAGALTATDATISGTVTAKAGYIGGNATNKITISGNATNAAIYYGKATRDDTASNGFYLGTDGLALGKGTFKVTNAGALTATSATISGSVTATAGTIGGWTVNDVRLYSEGEVDGVAYRAGLYAPASPGTGNRAFYIRVGSSTYPYSVYYDGSLVATKATITGTITAEAGIIGNKATNKITIGQATDYAAIYNGMTSLADTTHNGFYLGADGIALGKGKFKVTSAGALTATSANISGTITSQNATITGGTIQMTTSSSTNDSISLTYSNWETALQPLQLVAWNKSTHKRLKLQAGGIYFDKDVNAIDGEGTALSTLAGAGLWLRDDDETLRATLQGTGLWINDEEGVNAVTLQRSGLYINDANGDYRISLNTNGLNIRDDDVVRKAFIGAANRNGVVYLADSNGTIRANLNDGGLYLYGTSGQAYTTYGQHAIDFMPPPSSVNSTAYNTGGWIDFHYQRSTADYTSRLLGSANTTTAMPSITNGSDRRIKKNISQMTQKKYINLLKGLNPVKYEYRKFEGVHYGFIAQEVIELCESLSIDYSGLVNQSALYAPEDATEYYTLNYIDLVALLTKGIQELYKEVEELRAALA